MSEEDARQPAESTPEEDEKVSPRPTFQIGNIEGQIVNAGGEMSLSGGVNLNAAFSGATQNIHTHLANATEAADAVQHGGADEREELAQLVRELGKELETAAEQQQDEVLKVAKRLEALMEALEEREPDSEAVKITGESLKRAAANLAGVLPAAVRIAGAVVTQAEILAR